MNQYPSVPPRNEPRHQMEIEYCLHLLNAMTKVAAFMLFLTGLMSLLGGEWMDATLSLAVAMVLPLLGYNSEYQRSANHLKTITVVSAGFLLYVLFVIIYTFVLLVTVLKMDDQEFQQLTTSTFSFAGKPQTVATTKLYAELQLAVNIVVRLLTCFLWFTIAFLSITLSSYISRNPHANAYDGVVECHTDHPAHTIGATTELPLTTTTIPMTIDSPNESSDDAKKDAPERDFSTASTALFVPGVGDSHKHV